jgi:galactose mutarotase-like enzyme
MLAVMPSTQHRSSLQEAIGELYVLNDERADANVVVAPRRGAIVTTMRVAGRDLLYMQDATLSDPAQSVRGGIPVLFPTPGKLQGDTLHWGGRVGTDVKQHGFARILDWQVIDTPPGGLVLEIASNTWTLQRYPWAFRARLEFALDQRRLSIRFSVENTDQVPLPFALGFHPYFHVKHLQKSKLGISTAATQAFDNVQKQVVPFTGFDLTQPEVDLHLLDHGSTQCRVQLPDGGHIELRGSPDFNVWVVWTLEKKDFVCVEPWTAHGDALNTGERVIQVPPGATHHAALDIEYFPV